jgi:mannose-6-phosphate isomerase-like protein (cupin superfamily)
VKFHLDTASFKAERPWGSRAIGEIDDVGVRLHWTDAPYRWHVNEGNEAFVVLAGAVDMHYRVDGVERIQRLNPGDIAYAEAGDAHVAHPVGEARILVIERKDSA